ncbi:peptidoglycan-binding domain-containing protein [Streptomyces parvulus]|uniref:peptidoglycan-binding domain-containing protein n=1 Tax=Streptomyces parvulus TaxID=146923 RepID=UPI0033B7303E
MRVLTKAVVGAVTAAGIALGGLAAAGPAAAAPTPVQQSAQSEVGALAVVNLGLSKTQAMRWQCWLRDLGYKPGTIDGRLGSNSWEAAQTLFTHLRFYSGRIDGIVGPGTVAGLQRFLNSRGYGYNLAVDGVAGQRTQAAFADYADRHYC